MSVNKKKKISRRGVSRSKVVSQRAAVKQEKKISRLAVTKVKLPVLSFSEAETQLGEVIEALKHATVLLENPNRKVGEFWDSSWPAAPFEETMTLKQVVESSAVHMLRKRSFAGQKVTAFIYALRSALKQESNAERRGGANSAIHHREERQASVSLDEIKGGSCSSVFPQQILFRWITDQLTITMQRDGVSDLYITALRYLESQKVAGVTSKKYLANLVGIIPDLMDPVEYLALWQSCSVALNAEGGGSIRRAPVEAERIVRQVEAIAPDMLQSWRSSLTGPGVSEDLLFTPYLDTALDLMLQKSIGRVLLFAIGARPAVIKGNVLRGAWTLNEMAADMVFEAMAMTFDEGPRDEVLIAERVKSFFPLIEVEQIVPYCMDRAGTVTGKIHNKLG